MTPPSKGGGQSRAGPSTQSARQRSPPVQADTDTTWTQSIAALGVRSPQSAAWPVRLVVSVMARAKRSDTTRPAGDDRGDTASARPSTRKRQIQIAPKVVRESTLVAA